MSSPKVLLVGLPWDHPMVKKLAPNPEVIRDGLLKVGQDIENAGYTYKFFGTGPEEDINKLVEELKAVKYDGVAIGMGIRGNADLTVWFEELINTIHVHAPQTQFIFNITPPNTLDAVKRRLPISA